MKPVNEEFNYLDDKIKNAPAISSFYLKIELLMAFNRQKEAIETVEELGRRINNKKIALYEVSKFFFWRRLFSHSLLFINLALETYNDDEMCLKHKEEILLKLQWGNNE